MIHREKLEEYLAANADRIGEAFAELVRMLWRTGSEVFEVHIIDDEGVTANAEPVQIIMYTKGGEQHARQIANTPFEQHASRIEGSGFETADTAH